MENSYENLNKLLDRLRGMSLFSRLFAWRKTRQLLIDAVADFQLLKSAHSGVSLENSNLKQQIESFRKDIELTSGNLIKAEAETIRLNEIIKEQGSRIETYIGADSSKDTTIKSQQTKIHELEILNQELTLKRQELSDHVNELTTEVGTLKETVQNISQRKNELDVQVEGLTTDKTNLTREVSELKQTNVQLTTDEEQKRQKYESDIATLKTVTEKIQNDERDAKEAKNAAEIERIRLLKETWSKHQNIVQNTIKTLCTKHQIEYISIVPFKGEPDNTLKICDEFIVFDSKSPAGEDLANFSTYLREQAERAKKYAKQENVKKEVFFVVPTNTLEKINQFVYNLTDYDVFIISLDSLEQVMLSLRKIEDYQFVDTLSPDERDNICRILGKFGHLSKRRVQVDMYFARQFMELSYKSDAELPNDFLAKASEFEKSERINPPVEKRAKMISLKELDKDHVKLSAELQSKGILAAEEVIISGTDESTSLQQQPN